MRYFETMFLEEADEFIDSLDAKAIKKILYNLTLPNKPMTQNFLKNFKTIYGSCAQKTQDFKSDFLHFGINQTIKKRW
jgi:hypothetical protein